MEITLSSDGTFEAKVELDKQEAIGTYQVDGGLVLTFEDGSTETWDVLWGKEPILIRSIEEQFKKVHAEANYKDE